MLALFCVGVGFFRPIGMERVCAIAAPVAEVGVNERRRGREEGKGHEYLDRTRRLLETVSGLVRRIEEVRKGTGDMEIVERALKGVKLKRMELKEEILGELHAELKVLRNEKTELVKLSDKIVDSVARAKREEDGLLRALSNGKGSGTDGARERLARLEESMRGSDKEYAEIWDKIGNIEDQILSEETMALSVRIMELNFIERECVQLVKGFKREMTLRNIERYNVPTFHHLFIYVLIGFIPKDCDLDYVND